MPIKFKTVANLEDLSKAFAVRCIVFCAEQDVPYSRERDQYDTQALHIIGEAEGEPVAAARIRFDADYAWLQRIAIVKGFRGKGHGDELMRMMLQICADKGYRKSKLQAQIDSIGFYERHGFVADGEIFLDAGIKHRRMNRRL